MKGIVETIVTFIVGVIAAFLVFVLILKGGISMYEKTVCEQ